MIVVLRVSCDQICKYVMLYAEYADFEFPAEVDHDQISLSFLFFTVLGFHQTYRAHRAQSRRSVMDDTMHLVYAGNRRYVGSIEEVGLYR